ncbi:MAG: hypothetical protein AAF622_10195 [Cyanobacteria bacterium P01_C01_bin.147]
MALRLYWHDMPRSSTTFKVCWPSAQHLCPEENEAVLDAVRGDRAVVVPFKMPGLMAQPGLPHWQGQTYRADVRHAQRYFLHFNNTGGFFVARLHRTAVSPYNHL